LFYPGLAEDAKHVLGSRVQGVGFGQYRGTSPYRGTYYTICYFSAAVAEAREHAALLDVHFWFRGLGFKVKDLGGPQLPDTQCLGFCNDLIHDTLRFDV
jgi:hypothetical protein